MGYKEEKEKLKQKAQTKKSRSNKQNIKKVSTKGKSSPKKVVKKLLKENMKEEYTIYLSVVGVFKYIAGSIIELDESFGKFEGKYVIDSVTHSINDGYTVDIEASRVGAYENAKSKSYNSPKAKKSKKRKKKRKKKKDNKSKNDPQFLWSNDDKIIGKKR